MVSISSWPKATQAAAVVAQARVARLARALDHEQTRSGTQAAAFASGTRTFENLARDLATQYTAKLAKVEFAHDAATAAKDAAIAGTERRFAELEASHAATIAAKDDAIADMKERLAELKMSHNAGVSALQAAHASATAAKDANIEKLEHKVAQVEAAVVTKEAVILELQASLATLKATHAAAVVAHEAATAQHVKVEAENATLKAEATLQRAALRCAVTSTLALEIHPVRRDCRQFATLHVGPVPFHEASEASDGPQLPSYRFVIEAYTSSASGAPKSRQRCDLGFVPSHAPGDATAVGPVVGHDIVHYGGWRISVTPLSLLWTTSPARAAWRSTRPRPWRVGLRRHRTRRWSCASSRRRRARRSPSGPRLRGRCRIWIRACSCIRPPVRTFVAPHGVLHRETSHNEF
jgi:hypothetical protein